MNPLENPDAYDTAYLGGQPTPGCCVVTGFAELYDWDIKKSKGSTGASMTSQGKPPCDSGQIKCRLWEPHHFDDFEALLVLLRGTQGNGKDPAALSIEHPYPNGCGVGSVVVKKLPQLVNEGAGEFSATIDVIEFRKPVAAGGTANAATTQYVGGKTPAATGADAQAAEVAALLKQAGGP